MDAIRLEYEMKKKGYNVERLCKELGMSKSAYYRKLRGASEFTVKEVERIMEILNLTSPMGIFFRVRLPKG